MEKSADVETTSAAERALRISERRYRRLFEAAFDGILLLNAETAQIEDVNPYLVKLLGYSREEFLGKKVWELGAFKDTALSKQAFAELQEDHFIRYEDLPLETKDGRRIAVEFVSNVYLVEDLRANRLSGGSSSLTLGVQCVLKGAAPAMVDQLGANLLAAQ